MNTTKIEGVTRGGDLNGTSLQGYVTASYKDLVALLGEPNCDGDGYKVSTEWVLTFGGKTFTVYDYKATSLYDYNDMSVEAFRAQPSYEWHVGAHGDAREFVELITKALGRIV